MAEAYEEVVVIGAHAHPIRDIYHSLRKMPWTHAFGVVVLFFVTTNALFGLAYMLVGGISNAHPGSFRDAFFFSVQTMGTIGYGAMFPEGTAANCIVAAETLVGIVFSAVVTGMVFARFSEPSGSLVFSNKVTIGPHDGTPTMIFRIGNDRSSTIFEVKIRVIAFVTTKTKEGNTFYRMQDLKLTRDSAPALSRSWNIMHMIDPESPFFCETPESCAEKEIELMVSVSGTDDTSLQPVHARKRYVLDDVIWGARPADVLREREDGRLELDVRKFDDIVPTAPCEGFPFPRA